MCGKKLPTKVNCDECWYKLIASGPRHDCDCDSSLSCGGPLKPSGSLYFLVCSLFAEVDYNHLFIKTKAVQNCLYYSLNKMVPNLAPSCYKFDEKTANTSQNGN